MSIIFSYWKNLLLESGKTMVKELGILGLLFGLLVSGAYALSTGEQTFNWAGILVFAKVLFLLIIIAWIIFVFKVAATQDKNKDDNASKLIVRLKEIENKTPVILAVNPVVKPKGFVNKELRDAISIDVFNAASGTTAEKVFPTVTWFTMRGRRVTSNPGRWWMSTQDAALTKTADRQVMDLLSNGKTYPFHFAIQADRKEKFFAWYRESNGDDKRFDLQDKKYKVNIHFRSNNNAEANFNYIVTNNDGKLSIREVRDEKENRETTQRRKKRSLR